jgi:hypothetical protein
MTIAGRIGAISELSGPGQARRAHRPLTGPRERPALRGHQGAAPDPWIACTRIRTQLQACRADPAAPFFARPDWPHVVVQTQPGGVVVFHAHLFSCARSAAHSAARRG